MAKRTITDTLRLASSHAIPQLGFGVYKSPPELCIQSCLTALGAGYRHVDTAQYYANEAEVGEAVRRSGLDRRDVFLTTKILSPEASAEANYQKCLESVRKLDGDSGGYVDLFLIHSPNCGGAQNRMMLWQTLERLHQEGKAKSIGVSNFGIQHIEELKKSAKVWPPHVNQIEVSKHAFPFAFGSLMLTNFHQSCTLGRNKPRSSSTAKSRASPLRRTARSSGTPRRRTRT